jgi:hypothetical protein
MRQLCGTNGETATQCSYCSVSRERCMRRRSRDAIRARVMPTPFAKTFAAPDRRQTFPGVAAGFVTIRAAENVARVEQRETREGRRSLDAAPGFRSAQSGLRRKRKRKRNAERRRHPTTAPCGAALPQRGQHASRRSTAVLARGTLVPKAQRQAMLPGTWPERSILYARPNRGAETLRCSTGVTRAAPIPVQRSTSRTSRCAGRLMPEPPGSWGDEPKPAGTALAPPTSVTGRRPLRERDSQ